jgi:hypothetical protein
MNRDNPIVSNPYPESEIFSSGPKTNWAGFFQDSHLGLLKKRFISM